QRDRLRLDPGRVLVHLAVRGLDAEHLLAAEQERRPDDVEDLAGALAEDDVLGLDAVQVDDRVAQPAVRRAVAVGPLPGRVHRLHDGLWRTVRVLVVVQLGDLGEIERWARAAAGALARNGLTKQIGRSHSRVPEGGGDSTDEAAAAETHKSSLTCTSGG